MGTVGVFSYLAEGSNKKIFIMWCIPHAPTSYNYFNIEIKDSKYSPNEDIMNEMYNSSKQEYINNGLQVECNEFNFKVYGSMGTTGKTHLKIEIK